VPEAMAETEAGAPAENLAEVAADLDDVVADVEIPELPVEEPLTFTPRPVPAGAPIEMTAGDGEAPANVSRLADHQSLRHRILEGREKTIWPVRRARR
jgi:hypothetical protein